MVYIYIWTFPQGTKFAGCRKIDISQTPVRFHSNGTTRVVVFVRHSSERPPWTPLGPYCLAAVVAVICHVDSSNVFARSRRRLMVKVGAILGVACLVFVQ